MAKPAHPLLSQPAPLERREALWWHVGWLGVLVLSGAGLWIAPIGLGWPAVLALVWGGIPAAASLLLGGLDGPRARMVLLSCWGLASASACVLTGGVSGPLAAWCLAPVAAAAVLGGARPMAQGAALAFGAVALAALAQAFGATVAAPVGLAAFGLGLLSAVTMAMGLGAALVMARRRMAESFHAQGVLTVDLVRLLDAQADLIVIAAADGLVQATFGQWPPEVSPTTLRERGLLSLAGPSERPQLQDALATAAEEGRADPLILALAGSDGVHLSLEPRRLEGGRLAVTVRDVSAQHLRENALDNARQDAESLNIGKSRFLANMSHELRTPLNAIMGFSDIMRQRMFGPLPGKYVEYAELIHDAGAHLLDLINDVLDMSKIEAARYELAKEPLDAREPISAALRLMRLQADDAGVQLRGLLPPQPLEIDADRRALKQIALNLISNALKFTPRGGLVTVSAQSLAGALELSITDTGLGISKGDLQRLGRPYEQAGDMGQKTRGTGLGLSLVRAFAELHGGEMVIESQLGEGTAVTVRLPGLLEALDPAPSLLNGVALETAP